MLPTISRRSDRGEFSGAGIAVGFGGSARRADLVAGVAGLDS
jgi:hypothetical protein